MTKLPAYAVIIRAIHERGQTQGDALAELKRRGLWLDAEQRRLAELSDREGWTKPAQPGGAVRITYLERAQELGDVRIQQYDRKYRVAAFLPGVSVFLPGDTPKTEPEVSQWCAFPDFADRAFERLVIQAAGDGWMVRAWQKQ